MPNGNPVTSEKFGFKLKWFGRLIAHGAELLPTGALVVLAGDYNVMPAELDVYARSDGGQWRALPRRGPRRLPPPRAGKAGRMR